MFSKENEIATWREITLIADKVLKHYPTTL